MKTVITARQMTLRDSLRETIDRKLSKFDKFFGGDTEVYVTCRTRKGAKIIEITINYGGTMYRSEEESDTFITALDRATENLERQIRKNKTRLEKRVRDGAFRTCEPEDNDEFEEEGNFIIRMKTFIEKPMTAEEAILQMNLLGHTFFVFTDTDLGKTCVVYKRKDGDYGMIVPAAEVS